VFYDGWDGWMEGFRVGRRVSVIVFQAHGESLVWLCGGVLDTRGWKRSVW